MLKLRENLELCVVFLPQFTEKEAHEWGFKGTSVDKLTLA